MIFGGCYNGVEDAGADSTDDRWGKTCYYSYSSNSSASYKASSSSNNNSKSTKTDNGFRLTMKTDALSQNPEEMAHVLDALRFEAGVTASHHVAQSCWEADNIADACQKTCGERGLAWNEEAVVCDDCKVLEDGTVDCGDVPDALLEALSKPWFGQEPWFFTDDKAQMHLIMFPPHLEESWDGELVWVADVEVTGFCLCACELG